MKAALIVKHGSITVQDMPEPQVGPYDAHCELLYGATCTGTDSHIIGGNFPWISPLPTVLGHESVGRVVAVGKKVRHFRVGDLVTRVGTPAAPQAGISVTWGGFAEQGIAKDHWAMCADGLPAGEWSGHRVNQVIPYGIPETAAPMFITWRETLSYLTRMGLTAGQSILVVGSGGNGLAFTAHAKNLGAAVVAMAGAPRLAAAAQAKGGVTHYVDYHHTDLVAALRQAVPGGFDMIIDAIGKQGVVSNVLPCLKVGGKVGVYGIDDFGQVSVNITRACGHFTCQAHGNYDEPEAHQQVSDFIRQGKLDASLWYDLAAPYPLSQINAAFAAVQSRKSVKALVRLKG